MTSVKHESLGLGELGAKLFRGPPPPVGKYPLALDWNDHSLAYEILINLLMEGLVTLTEGVMPGTVKELDDLLDRVGCYLEGVNVKLTVRKRSFPYQDLDKTIQQMAIQAIFPYRYCRVVFREPEQQSSDDLAQQAPYQFLLNPAEVNRKSINDYYGLFIFGDQAFQIMFRPM